MKLAHWLRMEIPQALIDKYELGIGLDEEDEEKENDEGASEKGEEEETDLKLGANGLPKVCTKHTFIPLISIFQFAMCLASKQKCKCITYATSYLKLSREADAPCRRYAPPTDATLHMPRACCAVRVSLRHMLRELRVITESRADVVEEDVQLAEWAFLARVADRLLFWFFLAVMLALTLGIMVSAPHHLRSLLPPPPGRGRHIGGGLAKFWI